MIDSMDHHTHLPGWQQTIQARCYHPTGTFTPFAIEDIEMSVPDRFEGIVAQYGNRMAIKTQRHALTFNDVNHLANRIAHAIIDAHGRGNEPIALLFAKGAPLLAAFLGTLKAGKIYIPCESWFPKERINGMLTDAEVNLIVTDNEHLSLAKELSTGQRQVLNIDAIASNVSTENPRLSLSPDTLAYVIYTSGSLGQPKGVVHNHRTILHQSMKGINSFHLCPDDRLTLLASLSTSQACSDIYFGLLSGAGLYPWDIKTQGLSRLPTWIVENRLTYYRSSASVFRYFTGNLTGDEDLSSVRLVQLGGEAVHRRDLEHYKNHFSDTCVFVNALSSTETRLLRLYFADKDTRLDQELVPAGYAVSDTDVIVLNEQGDQVATNTVGEIAVKSRYLAVGYWRQPEQTQAAFAPATEGTDMRLFRTGDLGRIEPDGCLVRVDRKGDQVKIRGFRVEPTEIEEVLREHNSVKDAVVLTCHNSQDEPSLVAYVVPTQPEMASLRQLKEFIASKLPDYMSPSTIMIIDQLPLTLSGKLDRQTLPMPYSDKRLEGSSLTAPRTQDEELIVGIWTEVLGLSQVSVDDNFFDIGGHSLLATKIIARLQTTFQIEFPLQYLLEAPTVAGLAVRLQTLLHSEEAEVLEPIPCCLREGPLPPSFAQERLWVLQQLEPESPTYNIPLAFRLQGPLNHSALEQSLNQLVHRHESLRTTFVQIDGKSMQVIVPTLKVSIPLIDLQTLPEPEREAAMHQRITQEGNTPFDLSTGPLLRTQVLRLRPDEHVLLLTQHHIVSDGWSRRIFYEELSIGYEDFCKGQPSSLVPLPIHYADYAVWQREWLQGDVLAQQLSYWQQHLHDVPTALALPTDFPRPLTQSFLGNQQTFVLSPQLLRQLKTLGHKQQCTLFMTLLAAFQILLAKYTGQMDLVVGTPIANRTRQEIEGLIGFFVNTLVLRTRLTPTMSCRQLLHQVRATCLEAYRHQDLPFEKLVEVLQPERDPGRHPLVQVMFQLDQDTSSALALTGLTSERLAVPTATAKFDLSLALVVAENGLHGTVEYSTDLFAAESITRLIGHLHTLFEGLVANPDQAVLSLPLLTEAERHQQLVEWNDTTTPYPNEACIHQLFEAQVARTPDAIAVVDEDQQLTYEVLNQRADHVADHLRQHHMGTETLVGVHFKRSLDMIMALLGILKTGASYLPLDPNGPQERLAWILKHSQVRTVLSEQNLWNQHYASEGQNGAAPFSGWVMIVLPHEREFRTRSELGRNSSTVHSQSIAYTMYTSGSTGTPKGVMVPHHALVNHAYAVSSHYQIGPRDRVLQFASLTFDVAAEELFSALAFGATVVLRSDHALTSVNDFLHFVARHEVSLLNLPASYWHEWMATAAQNSQPIPPAVRRVVVGSETVLPEHLATWQNTINTSAIQCCNAYGVTEATITTTIHDVLPNDHQGMRESVPIGRPISNTRIHVLDYHLQPVPIGVTGEIYIAGEGLARGYVNRPDLTAERFLPNPLNIRGGERLFKTGDLGRYLPDGNVVSVGRTDHQIKLRGYRIELGEIETLLQTHTEVRATVVLCREDRPGEKQLVAYLVGEVSPSALRSYLQERLPAYMLPSAFVVLKELPLTPNSKVDRRALPAPDPTHRVQAATFTAPRTLSEELVATVWQEVLHLEQVGIHDNFFELGGHSLLATKVIARLRQILEFSLPLRTIFENPTIVELAQVIETQLPNNLSE